jgi:hypothetical protein
MTRPASRSATRTSSRRSFGEGKLSRTLVMGLRTTVPSPGRICEVRSLDNAHGASSMSLGVRMPYCHRSYRLYNMRGRQAARDPG